MKLDVLHKKKVRQSGGYRWTAVFSTPLVTKVVRIKDRYYPISCRGEVNLRLHYLGRDNDFEVWRFTGRKGSAAEKRLRISEKVQKCL